MDSTTNRGSATFLLPLLLLLIFCHPIGAEWYLTVDPPTLRSITEDVPYSVNLTLGYNGTWDSIEVDALFSVSVFSTNSKILFPVQERIDFTWEDVIQGYNQTLDVIGLVVGYADLNFHLEIVTSNQSSNRTLIPLLSGYLVTVLRKSNFWLNVFTLMMGTVALLNTVNIGCGLDLNTIKTNLMRPVGPFVGFVSQFVFMPLVSLGLALALIKDPLQGFGLLVLGCCPGGAMSNFWTLLLGGDVDLSITMTFISTIAALGMMPLWMWFLSGYFLTPGSAVKVPYIELVVSLTALTVPLLIGLLIRQCNTSLAQFLAQKMLKPCTFIILAVMGAVGLYTLWDLIFLLDVYMLTAGFCVAMSGFVFGGLFAWLTRRTTTEIIAISLETAMQNGNVAFVLLRLSLSSPYSDVASMTPIAQIVMTTIILVILWATSLFYQWYNQRSQNQNQKKSLDLYYESSLILKPNYQSSEIDKNDEVTIRYHGGDVTREYSWARNPSLIVPNSPVGNLDPRIF